MTSAKSSSMFYVFELYNQDNLYLSMITWFE